MKTSCRKKKKEITLLDSIGKALWPQSSMQETVAPGSCTRLCVSRLCSTIVVEETNPLAGVSRVGKRHRERKSYVRRGGQLCLPLNQADRRILTQGEEQVRSRR